LLNANAFLLLWRNVKHLSGFLDRRRLERPLHYWQGPAGWKYIGFRGEAKIYWPIKSSRQQITR
jgi:hypothetical protein